MKTNLKSLDPHSFALNEDILPSKQDTAAYSASMLSSLARMARGSELNVLAYLIDMARLEAESTLNS